MAQVVIKINGRSYPLACDDGEEDHLRGLAAYLDKHVAMLAHDVGQVGDDRLMLMTALMVADELSDARGQVRALKDDVAALERARDDATAQSAQAETRVADILDTAAARLEDIAARL